MKAISIIIPTYNRAERLKACLEALAKQTQPADDFEVVVVIDGSSDNTLEVLSTCQTPYSLQTLLQANQGPNVARNRGVAAACSRYCLFIDDDIIADPRLVETHLRFQHTHERAVGIGQILFSSDNQRDWFTKGYVTGWESHYRLLNQTDEKPSWKDCYGGNMSMPRQIFAEVGGFAADLRRSHDIELAYRLSQIGVEFVYLAEAIGHQDDRKGVVELATDAQNFGAAWVALCLRYPVLLPQVLGGLVETSTREKALRRFVWALRLTPIQLNVLGSLCDKLWPKHKWYRFIHKYFYWRGVQLAMPERDVWRNWTRGTTILMYHAFSAPGEPSSRYIVAVQRFRQQMSWLKRLGYHVISLEEYVLLRRENRMPRRTVVITIDDGYVDVYTLAFPVLRDLGFSATVFAVSGRIGANSDWPSQPELQGRPLLSWPQIMEMNEHDIRLGSHTCSHPKLLGISGARAIQELQESKLELEAGIHEPVETLAYPYGAFDAQTQAMAERAGYQASCSVESGQVRMVTSLHALRRTEVDGRHSLLHFLWILWTGIALPVISFGKMPRLPNMRKDSVVSGDERLQSQ
jgi:glycosyltransferase involved in cell wall biosynthesis/peptidoglycan/xylan/chitin deacetylase (PgdA/CDA1 family)